MIIIIKHLYKIKRKRKKISNKQRERREKMKKRFIIKQSDNDICTGVTIKNIDKETTRRKISTLMMKREKNKRPMGHITHLSNSAS